MEQMENDLLAGAVVPPPPAPQVQATLDALLAKMKSGVIGEGGWWWKIFLFLDKNAFCLGKFLIRLAISSFLILLFSMMGICRGETSGGIRGGVFTGRARKGNRGRGHFFAVRSPQYCPSTNTIVQPQCT